MDRPLEVLRWSIFRRVLAHVKILLMAYLHLSSDLLDSFETEERIGGWRFCGKEENSSSPFVFHSHKTLKQILGLSPKRSQIFSNLTHQRRLLTPRPQAPLLKFSYDNLIINFVTQNWGGFKVGMEMRIRLSSNQIWTRIKIKFQVEFKSNLNSNWTRFYPYLRRMREKTRASDLHAKTSCKIQVCVENKCMWV